MCLNKITKISEDYSGKKHIGYKTFYLKENKHLYSAYNPDIEIGCWYSAVKKRIECRDTKDHYVTGFHIFLTLEDAANYLKIVHRNRRVNNPNYDPSKLAIYRIEYMNTSRIGEISVGKAEVLCIVASTMRIVEKVT